MLSTLLKVLAWLIVLLVMGVFGLFLLWLRIASRNLGKPQPDYYKSSAIKAKAWKRLAEHRKRQSKARKKKKA